MADETGKSAKRSGSLFEFSPCNAATHLRLQEYLEGYPLLREILDIAWQQCADDPDHVTDMSSLMRATMLSRPGVLGRCDQLQTFGCLTKATSRQDRSKRAVTSFTFVPPDQALARGPVKQLERVAPNEFDLDAGTRGTHLSYDAAVDRRIAWKGERFTVFTLLSGLRIGTSGKETEHKETRVFLGDRYFDLTVTAQRDEMIPGVTDLRALIVVLTLVREFLDGQSAHLPFEKSGRPAAGFELSMRDICNAMGMTPSPSNKRAVYAQLIRWSDSNFTITRVMRGALTWASTMFELGTKFRVLNTVSVIKTKALNPKPDEIEDAKVFTPQRVHISLNERLLEALQNDERSLSIHPAILRSGTVKAAGGKHGLQPYVHLVYYWCRRVIKHSHEPKHFQIEHLHRELNPSQPLSKFTQDWKRFMQKTAVPGAKRDEQISEVPGYVIRYNAEAGIVWFMANPSDPIVGISSPYTRKSVKAPGHGPMHVIPRQATKK